MKKAIQQFPVAYFALIMSTGIISLAADGLHLQAVAEAFFYVNLMLYPLFVLLLVLRVVMAFQAVRAELTSHDQGATYLTLVPATCLLGNQFVQLRQQTGVGSALWMGAAVVWLILVYSFLLGVSVGEEKPPLEKGFNGSWLASTGSSYRSLSGAGR
ncbi:hypothetical protein [Hymenobacter sp. DG01]|uniref:SLAC1 family transporter n=1 Tax=Hymenobacter sp. DG01 TaxID=2584940 RepID=UPI0011223863|nr:hypothetical protein [Hymenobacter sp. DG01]